MLTSCPSLTNPLERFIILVPSPPDEPILVWGNSGVRKAIFILVGTVLNIKG